MATARKCKATDRLFVVDFGQTPAFCVNLEGYETRARTEAARAWMQIGQGQFDDWRVCKRTGPAEFKCVETGKSREAGRSGFTPDAWQKFLNSFTL
jgi:hypothetical protein